MARLVLFSVAAVGVAPGAADVGDDTSMQQCPSFAAAAVDTDLAGTLIDARFAATSDGCCSLCTEEDGCEGFAYLNQTCYLKGNFSGTFQKTGVVSRLRGDLGQGCPGFGAAEQNTDLSGDTLEVWHALNPESCCAACAESLKCQGFAFDGNRCYLKGNVRGTYANVGVMVRVKLPAGGPTCPDFSPQASGTDLFGELLAAIPVEQSATVDDCCPLCDKMEGCEGFVHFEQVCYLKGSFSGTFQKAGVVSRLRASLGAGCPGYKAAEQNMDLAGDLLEQWSASSPEQCCAACGPKPDCQGFAFAGNQCYLKGNVVGTYPNPGAIARMKEGFPAGISVSTSVPLQQCPSFGAQLVDVDMAGDLLGSMPVATIDGCCAECQTTAGCQGFAYFQETCYLKGRFSGTFQRTGVVSQLQANLGAGCPGFQAEEQNMDLAGDMLEQWSAPSPDLCCAACAIKPICQGFVFLEDRCYLKTNVTGTYPNPDRVVRVKDVRGGVRRLGGIPMLI